MWIYPPHVRHRIRGGVIEGGEHRLCKNLREVCMVGFGPLLLLDKSILQGLSSDGWLCVSRYYRHVLLPILLRELTSDIVKVKKGRTEKELRRMVGSLATKAESSQSWGYCRML